MKERDIVRKIRKAMEAAGWLVWKNHGGPFAESGLPDLMALRSGQFVAIEVKRPGGNATKLQSDWLERCRKHGGIATVALSVEDISQIFPEFRETRAGENVCNW